MSLSLRPLSALGLLFLWLWATGPGWSAALDQPVIAAAAPNTKLAQEVRALSAQALPVLSKLIGTQPQRIKIVVAGSREEFGEWMQRLKAPAWAAGVAAPGLGLIVLRSPAQLTRPEEFGRVLVHELTHIYLHQNSRGFAPPLWLEESIAMYAARSGGLGLTSSMASAVLGGRLVPFARLTRRFPQDPRRAEAAYAQSYYFLAYLMNKYGAGTVPRLLAEMARGRKASQALLLTTGKGLKALEKDFFQAMETRFSWLSVLTAGGTLWGVAALIAAVGLVLRRRAHLRERRAMPEEEGGGPAPKERRRVESTSPRKKTPVAKTDPGSGEGIPKG